MATYTSKELQTMEKRAARAARRLEYASPGDKAIIVLDYALLLLILTLVLYPMLFIVKSSFSGDVTGHNSYSLWITNFSLGGYQTVFEYQPVWTAYGNSLLYMALGTVINLVVTVCCAYPLSRNDLPLRRSITFLFIFTMYFSGGLIPTYLLIRSLGLVDTLWVMVIPNAMSVYNMIVTRTYFNTQIPQELREAADLDGCGTLRFLLSVVLPLSGPILAVIGLFYAVSHWNAYFHAMIYLTTRSRFPLQVVLRDLLIVNESYWLSSDVADAAVDFQSRAALMKYSLIVVASAPMMLLYPFVQKFFVKGVMIGAVKG